MSNPRPESRSLRAVIFDLGGVVLGSPLHAIARYESSLGIPENAINRVVMDTAPGGAWHQLERGEIDMPSFFRGFEKECAAAGHPIDASAMFGEMAAEAKPRPAMLRAIERIKAEGLRVAALTNNWATEESTDAPDSGTRALASLFDEFVESSVEGLRKPDPRIYELVCGRLGVAPQEAAFLDDIGANLKPARSMGMTTIRVVQPEPALAELEAALGFSLS
ncbi:MAG: HAD family phosphatase [Myxococcota bacterium]|nr:HAD family phosphatase [Myxococcota bacterium]